MRRLMARGAAGPFQVFRRYRNRRADEASDATAARAFSGQAKRRSGAPAGEIRSRGTAPAGCRFWETRRSPAGTEHCRKQAAPGGSIRDGAMPPDPACARMPACRKAPNPRCSLPVPSMRSRSSAARTRGIRTGDAALRAGATGAVLRAEKRRSEESGCRGWEDPARRGRCGSTYRSETGEIRGVEDTESGRRNGKRVPPAAGIFTSGKSRREAAESSGRLADVIGLGFSRRRIRIETLLVSVRRSMPRFRRYWLPCSREQKSSPAPTHIRLSGLPHNKQVLALIFRLIIGSGFQNY